MNELLDRLDALQRPKVLSHIDSVADNFLFLPDGSVRLIDWEYSGMCDPLIDISMCAIYSYYDEDAVTLDGSRSCWSVRSFTPTLPWADSCGRCGPCIRLL